jgi:hypothetical protein
MGQFLSIILRKIMPIFCWKKQYKHISINFFKRLDNRVQIYKDLTIYFHINKYWKKAFNINYTPF